MGLVKANMTLSHSYSAKSDSRFKDYGVRNGSRSKRIKMASAKGIDPKLKNLKIKTGVVKRYACVSLDLKAICGQNDW